MGILETTEEAKGGLDTSITDCMEQEKEGLETTGGLKGSVETIDQCKGSLETTSTDGLDKGCLETTSEAMEDLEVAEQVAEESAVISLGEDEDEEEEEERDEGPARYLAALEAVQLELEAVEEEAARAFRRLRTRFCLRRRPHLQRRNRLIQHIPGFWVTAFLNHPQLSAMISDRDEDALSYMTSLQVPGWEGINRLIPEGIRVFREGIQGPPGEGSQVCSGADPGPHLRPREAVVEVIFHLVVLGQAEQVAVLHVHQVLGLPGSRESARGRPRGSEDHPG
uniref:TSYL2 protein n=1 Tax=Malurus cyaneus samueli TaxID=2593467 RepID=A0A8C5TW48_9PASS